MTRRAPSPRLAEFTAAERARGLAPSHNVLLALDPVCGYLTVHGSRLLSGSCHCLDDEGVEAVPLRRVQSRCRYQPGVPQRRERVVDQAQSQAGAGMGEL